jgi:3-deoxy-D-manno-octulosonic-acid transferase
LGLFDRLVPVVFMGGSLIPHGGQNLLEPAKIGCAIVHGPHMTNFDAITAEMQAAGATMVAGDKATLATEIGRLLGDETLRAGRIAAATRVAAETRGILDAFMAELSPYLDALAAPQAADTGTAARHARA